MKKDLVIGIVGTLILLTAMVGVFRYEATQRGASFDLTWSTRTVEGEAVDGGTNEGDASSVVVDLAQLNVTQAEFVLEWTDNLPNSQPDLFNLTVTSPDGRTRSAQGDSGRVSVVFEDLSIVPEAARLLGSDEEAARAQATRQFSSARAVGAWNVTVTLVQAGDVATTPAGPVPVGPLQDGANDWTLRPVLTVYEGQLARA